MMKKSGEYAQKWVWLWNRYGVTTTGSSSDVRTAPAADRAAGLTLLAHLAYWSGRLDEGRNLLVRADALLGVEGTGVAWRHRLLTRLTEALLGDAAWARAWLRDGMPAVQTLPPHQREHRDAAVTLVYAGDHAGARDVLLDWRDVLTEVPDPPPGGCAPVPRAHRRVWRLSVALAGPAATSSRPFPHLLEGRDLLGRAATGATKTAAFALLLQLIETPGEGDRRYIRALASCR